MTYSGPQLRDPTQTEEYFQDPYPLYKALRDSEPVFRSPETGRWLLTRHADVAFILRHDDMFHKQAEAERGRTAAMSMLSADPPDHTRLRGLVNKAFTPRRVEALRTRIESLVDGLLDDLEGRGEADFIDAFAYPLPITVIAELLGVPSQDHEKFRRWGYGVALRLGATVTEGDPSVQRMARRAAATPPAPAGDEESIGFFGYLSGIVAQRRSEPRDDLISELIASEQEGDKLSQGELIAMLVLLLIAGHETTVNLLGNGLHALLRHRDQLERFRDDPGLSKTAVEELLRYDSPVQRTGRVVGRDIEIGGTLIRAGEWVSTLVGAANRDPEVFDKPDDLDLSRNPNPHMSFAAGIHFCLGAQLARLEGQVAFPRILERIPDIELATDQLTWRPAPILRGLEALPVRV